jgi:hypothetical protein
MTSPPDTPRTQESGLRVEVAQAIRAYLTAQDAGEGLG